MVPCAVRPTDDSFTFTSLTLAHDKDITISKLHCLRLICIASIWLLPDSLPGHVDFELNFEMSRLAVMWRWWREISSVEFTRHRRAKIYLVRFWFVTCGGGCGSGCWEQLMTFVDTFQTRQVRPIFVLHAKFFKFFHFFQVKAYIVDPCAMQFQTGIGRGATNFHIVRTNFEWRWHWAAATAAVCCIWCHRHFHIWNCLHLIYDWMRE